MRQTDNTSSSTTESLATLLNALGFAPPIKWVNLKYFVVGVACMMQRLNQIYPGLVARKVAFNSLDFGHLLFCCLNKSKRLFAVRRRDLSVDEEGGNKKQGRVREGQQGVCEGGKGCERREGGRKEATPALSPAIFIMGFITCFCLRECI